MPRVVGDSVDGGWHPTGSERDGALNSAFSSPHRRLRLRNVWICALHGVSRRALSSRHPIALFPLSRHGPAGSSTMAGNADRAVYSGLHDLPLLPLAGINLSRAENAGMQ